MKRSNKLQGPEIASPDCLVFDVDGVLIDAETSFPAMIRATVEEEWGKAGYVVDGPGYSPAHNDVLKRQGAFNDDYDIVWILLNVAASRGTRLSTALPPPDELAEIVADCEGSCLSWLRAKFTERFVHDEIHAASRRNYFGYDGGIGTYKMEVPLLHKHWNALPLPAYVYTGRYRDEWRLAQELLGWEDMPDERVVHVDTGMRKPSPDGLVYLCKRFGHERPLFFGDTASDLKAHRAFGKGFFAAIGEHLRRIEPHFDSVEEALSRLVGGEKQ